jgi:dynein heavy chain
MDPMLDNVLNKSIIYTGKRASIKLGGNDIDYHKNFKLYITTRMSNPHYTPEVSTKVVLVNFTVKESGLEEQCLGIVVKSEQPTIEQKKNQEVMNIAQNKKTLIDLEDKILRLLSESKGNLLEDVTLNETLKTSKKTSEKVKNDLEAAEQTMKRIDETRETYRICGRVASILFFVLNDLNKIDPMYQFSLEWYKKLFQSSIEESKEHGYGDRIKNIIKTHTFSVYK